MSDNGDNENPEQEQPAPGRVTGTPPHARGMLSDLGEAGQGVGETGRAFGGPSGPGGGGERPSLAELPASPTNLFRAKRAERIVAALFMLAAVSGAGFIAAYGFLRVYQKSGYAMLDAVLRSNLALGTTMAVTFLALGAGFTIWVRHVMPDVELVEERPPNASSPREREAFRQTFMEGADASGFLKRPM